MSLCLLFSTTSMLSWNLHSMLISSSVQTIKGASILKFSKNILALQRLTFLKPAQFFVWLSSSIGYSQIYIASPDSFWPNACLIPPMKTAECTLSLSSDRGVREPDRICFVYSRRLLFSFPLLFCRFCFLCFNIRQLRFLPRYHPSWLLYSFLKKCGSFCEQQHEWR